MACDTCGQTGKRLVDLRDMYQTDHVKQVCDDCEKVISKNLWEVQAAMGKIQRSLMARFLDHLRWRGHSDRQMCTQPGCTQTDGAPCAYPQCPQRSAQE